MSTHVLAIWPTAGVDEPRGTLPTLLTWGASLVLLAPLIAVAAAASLMDIALARRHHRAA